MIKEYANEFVASEIMPNYWAVWWEMLIPKKQLAGQPGYVHLLCEVRGVSEPEGAITGLVEIAVDLGIKLPELQRKGRNTT